MPDPVFKKDPADPTPPSVSCQPLGPGCDPISMSAGGAKGVKGLNAVDSGTLSTNTLVPPDIEPADQGLCAGNGYVVEDNNIGEILVFNQRLQRKSAPIPLDTLMGLDRPGLEQRRRHLLPLRRQQRRALVLHRDRLDQLRRQRRTLCRVLLRHSGQ